MMTIMTVAAVIVFVVIGLFWAISVFVFRGADLSAYDHPPDVSASQSFPGHEGPSDGHWDAVEEIEMHGMLTMGKSRSDRLVLMRDLMEQMGLKRQYAVEISPVDVAGIAAEWVRAPGADSSRRVLYIHGGAFIAGSPLSHRNLTSRFSEVTGASVLAIDYRLMPEHPRRAGIEDCRTAYKWILENGPHGPGPVSHLVVSGDSAGGNLTLSLCNWVRDQGLRPADAIVALSPTVDATFTSPSIATNVATDVMLGPLFSILMKIPAWIRRWLFVLENRFNPSDPEVSPIFADLSDLPPMLIQVSEVEMLLDDARRYVNKANASGSRALVQSWGHMMHVWHIFYPEVTEAEQAWQEIRKFVDSTAVQSDDV